MRITAIGDVFAHSTKSFINNVKKDKHTGDRLNVTPETTFIGLDAYQKVIDSGVDLVILATPPGFRPIHLEAAVKAGKHIFTEKPVAVDPAGIRKVLALVEESKKKNLAIVAGTQRRHQKGYIETIAKLQNDKAIGDILAGRVYWNNGGSIWFRPRSRNMSDTEYQIHNWYHFCWLCGDHITEQHVHNLDVANWVLGSHPISCVGMGGRVRPCKDPNVDGQIFDHFAVEYEYPNGVIVQSYCRQIDNCQSRQRVRGFHRHERRNARCTTAAGRSTAPIVPRAAGRILRPGTHRPGQQHQVGQAAQRTATGGRKHDDGHHGPHVGLHRPRTVTWDQAMNSKLDLMPSELKWDGKLEASAVPYPGKTKFV